MGELVRMTNGDALPVPVEVTCPNHGFEQVSLAPEGQTADFQIENLKTAPLLQEMQQMREALQTMAGLLRATNESMMQLQRQVRLLEKVTPAQAGALNKAIRERATKLCAIYMVSGCDKAVAAAIRRAVKMRFGANSAKELPRCEYDVALAQVQGWDDYMMMKGIREKVKQ